MAKRYVRPGRRWLVVAFGLLGAVLIAGLVAYGLFVDRGRFLSAGPVASAHASFENDCESCHEPLASPSPERCNVCHERLGDDLGAHTYAAHYVYRSGNFGRIALRSEEGACQTCHVEHRGREAQLTRTTDRMCVACHDFGSFHDGHPEFAPLRDGAIEASNLNFEHTHHVAELMKRNGWFDPERACLGCHRPELDGIHFADLDFDSQCDECHLPAELGTPRLRVGDPSDPSALGVLTLEAIQESGAPGTDWSFFTNPNELHPTGSRISKRPLHHRDPWVMENLKQIRRALYPDAGLGDLLRTSADVDEGDQSRLYREALSTLRLYSLELRSRPEEAVQAELRRVDELLSWTEERLRDPSLVLDETRFLLDGALNPELDGGQVEELEDLATTLAQPCLQCHELEAARLRRVRADQRSLVRSRFDHRAHILQRRCVDCHDRIPILENLTDPTTLSAEEDRAEVLNLPSSQSCSECHNAEQVSDRCVTCHDFHPRKTRSDLLLYVDHESDHARQALQ